jgi:hypothetical protein
MVITCTICFNNYNFLHSGHRVHLWVLYESHNKQQLLRKTALKADPCNEEVLCLFE